MAVEEQRRRVSRSIEEKLGVEEAAYLIEGRPPGGWDSLVTKEYLDLRLQAFEARFVGIEGHFGALEERIERRFAELTSSVDRRLRAQTWIMTGTLITGLCLALGVGQAL